MSNRKYITDGKKYSSRNFSEIVELLIPAFYLEDDITNFGKAYDILDTVIESHLNIAANINTIINVKDGNLFKDITTFNGIAPFFIKQNENLEKSPYDFYKEVLLRDGVRLDDFQSSSTFKDYLDNTLLRKIRTDLLPVNPTSPPTPPEFATHDEMIQALGWFYFLNSGTADSVQPSSIVSDYIVKNIFAGQGFTLADGINCLTEYLWRNSRFHSFIPSIFLPGTTTYTSGTQQLEKLKTINTILYSNEYFNKFDTRIYEAFNEYEQLNYYSKELLSNGPFWKLLKAYSFSFADIQNETDKLKTLYDLQDCPDDLLPELAYLIGWDLLGSDPDKWRVQLYNAVDIYKKTGTKQSIQAAINAVFTEGVVEITSDILELWESYIPFLIFYALATESYLFKGYDTWTREIANDLSVDKYDLANFETNIRLGVDRILLNLFNKFPTLFKLGNKPFPRNSENFQFNYRGRNYPIPPFEEIPYYLSCEITRPFVDSLVDELICFGVTSDFATKIGNYILRNTITSTYSYQEENGWLMFTSSLELPTNFDSLLSILGDQKEKYLSLWNGKSSHYQLTFRASDFDFTKFTYEADSKQVILIAARAAKAFSPAHAIANFKVTADSEDDYTTNTDSLFNYLLYDYKGSLSEGPESQVISNFENLGVDFLGSEIEFSSLGRNRYDSLTLPAYSGNLEVNGRNTFRRRNYRSSLEINSYYDRSGNNQPIFFDSAISGLSRQEEDALLPMGYIPSALSYYSSLVATDCSSLVSSIHPSLDRCNFVTDASFFGYDSSATLKCRGYGSLDDILSGARNPVDRSNLDPFMYLIYKIESIKLELEAQKQVEDNQELYQEDLLWKNVSGSIANTLFSCNTLLSSLDSYRNYPFGQKIHRLFNLYTSSFNYHPTQKYSDSLDKSNILIHCFGNIIKNGEFSGKGSKGIQYNLFASSLDSAIKLTATSIYFSGDEAQYGPTLATHPSSLVVVSPSEYQETVEIVNSSIAESIDLIHTSGGSSYNEFTLYDLLRPTDSYAYRNPLIKMKSVDGLPRLRFTIQGSPGTEQYGSYRDHFLHPDHEFKLKLKGLAALDDGSLLADSQLGVWIHTKSENTKHSWHYNNQGEWELIDINDINKDLVLERLTHRITFDTPDISASSIITRCREEFTVEVDRSVPELLEAYYSEKEITFNTLNKCMSMRVPDSYFKDKGQAHRFDQSYVIEVFMIPTISNVDKFMLLDSISLRDETLWDHTRLELDPDLLHTMTHPLCSSKKLDLTPDDIRTIFQFYNTIAGKGLSEGPLSRDSTKSDYANAPEGTPGGGGRLSYRLNPAWLTTSFSNTTGQYTLVDFEAATAPV